MATAQLHIICAAFDWFPASDILESIQLLNDDELVSLPKKIEAQLVSIQKVRIVLLNERHPLHHSVLSTFSEVVTGLLNVKEKGNGTEEIKQAIINNEIFDKIISFSQEIRSKGAETQAERARSAQQATVQQHASKGKGRAETEQRAFETYSMQSEARSGTERQPERKARRNADVERHQNTQAEPKTKQSAEEERAREQVDGNEISHKFLVNDEEIEPLAGNAVSAVEAEFRFWQQKREKREAVIEEAHRSIAADILGAIKTPLGRPKITKPEAAENLDETDRYDEAFTAGRVQIKCRVRRRL